MFNLNKNKLETVCSKLLEQYYAFLISEKNLNQRSKKYFMSVEN